LAKAKYHAIIVGGGLAGLMSAIKIAEAGSNVSLFSLVDAKRSHSVCAQGGVNAAVNTKGEGDSPWIHFQETIYGGDFLANQPPVLGMCEEGPNLIYLLDRMGVMFNRTPEGFLQVEMRGGGTKFSRGLFAGATTGQQMLYALDEQVRRFEAAGLVTRYEGWEFISIVKDDAGVCRGITAMNLRGDATARSFPADVVILATGGCGSLFGKATASHICNGSAASAVYQQGAIYANGEFIQVHPTAIPGDDKCRLMSESLRGGGGRVWTYKDGKKWYFLEEWYPAYKNLVPRDVASRAIHKVCREMKLGIDGSDMVYLDVTHIPAADLDRLFGGVLEIYEKFAGEDPRKVPMKVFPAVHYSMGGLWVDYKQMTSIPGLMAIGECEYQYHGANRLGANALLSCLYAGFISGPIALEYAKGLGKKSGDVDPGVFAAETKRQQEINAKIMSPRGKENPFQIQSELSDWMWGNVTVVRYNDKLKKTDEKILELLDRFDRMDIADGSVWANQSLSLARQLHNMLVLSRVITLGALNRNESRGVHYKPDFPKRDDENWLKTTKAQWSPDGPVFSYEPVDVSLFKPRERRYDKEFKEEKKAL
jgi:succinate dehydrogenase / fumarate reductase flavoprotein subunit